MKATTGFWIALATGTLTGCVPMPPAPPPPPTVTALPNCGVAVQSRSCPDAAGACVIKVTLQGSGPTALPVVDPDELLVSAEGPVHIVWQLPRGAHFIGAQQDGVFVMGDDKDQFANNYPTDDANGFPGNGKKGQNYHWQFENSIKSKYKYVLRFRVGRNVYQCDPLINNQG